MGIEELDNSGAVAARWIVLDYLFTHSLFKLNATNSGSTITILNKL